MERSPVGVANELESLFKVTLSPDDPVGNTVGLARAKNGRHDLPQSKGQSFGQDYVIRAQQGHWPPFFLFGSRVMTALLQFRGSLSTFRLSETTYGRSPPMTSQKDSAGRESIPSVLPSCRLRWHRGALVGPGLFCCPH